MTSFSIKNFLEFFIIIWFVLKELLIQVIKNLIEILEEAKFISNLNNF